MILVVEREFDIRKLSRVESTCGFSSWIYTSHTGKKNVVYLKIRIRFTVGHNFVLPEPK